jgi:hypothetical protein
MSLCPSCGRALCDHTPRERGQTEAEMMRELSPEERHAWETEPPDSPEKIRVAQKHAHDPV